MKKTYQQANEGLVETIVEYAGALKVFVKSKDYVSVEAVSKQTIGLLKLLVEVMSRHKPIEKN